MEHNGEKAQSGEKEGNLRPSASRRIMMISTHGYVAADPPLGAPDTGGQVVYVIELSKKIAQFGYKVDIWTRQFEDQVQVESVDENVRVIRVPCGGKDFIPKEYLYKNIPEWVKNAKAYIDRHNLEYSFVNSHYWDAGLAGQLISEQLEIPHVHTPHSIGSWKKEQMQTDYRENADSFEEKYNFNERIAHENRIYRTCDLLIATTPIQVDKIGEDYDVSQTDMRMIPPGYDDNRFYPVGESSREALRTQLNWRGPTVFAVSRLADNKGLDLLIDSFSLVHQRIPDARLVLAIGHDDRSPSEQAIFEKLQSVAKNGGVQECVDFMGYISDEDLPEYYRAADLFVLSSRYEPFGMTAIEAMASGTPCVVTMNGGLHRVLDYGVHALFADPFDKQELGINMYQVLQHRGLHDRLKLRGAQRARARFTWTGIAQHLLNEVETLTDAGPA